jgi:inner membrane protein
MDSVTQFALGSAVAVAVMGRRTAVWKAALWGGACGTLPDLDALIDFGDPIRNMTMHRADSHSLFWLTLVSPAIAWAAARLDTPRPPFRRWWLAVWLALVTHPLLDLMNVYGTQLARPFTDHPYAVGSIFIADPLYTLPLLAGLVVALRRGDARGLRWNRAGLAAGTAYLAWGVAAQQHVTGVAAASLAREGIVAQRVLVTATPFNTVLWRVVAMTPDGHHEGFRSLLDRVPHIDFELHRRDRALHAALAGNADVARVAAFSQGFYLLQRQGDRVTLADLRMGQAPGYAFMFDVARLDGATGSPVPVPPAKVSGPVTEGGLRWLLRRAAGVQVPPPTVGQDAAPLSVRPPGTVVSSRIVGSRPEPGPHP